MKAKEPTLVGYDYNSVDYVRHIVEIRGGYPVKIEPWHAGMRITLELDAGQNGVTRHWLYDNRQSVNTDPTYVKDYGFPVFFGTVQYYLHFFEPILGDPRVVIKTHLLHKLVDDGSGYYSSRDFLFYYGNPGADDVPEMGVTPDKILTHRTTVFTYGDATDDNHALLDLVFSGWKAYL